MLSNNKDVAESAWTVASPSSGASVAFYQDKKVRFEAIHMTWKYSFQIKVCTSTTYMLLMKISYMSKNQDANELEFNSKCSQTIEIAYRSSNLSYSAGERNGT